jgi:hypothetical protein
MINSNFTFLTIWIFLFVSVILLGSWSLADKASKSVEYNNLTKEELSLVQKSAIFICPLH